MGRALRSSRSRYWGTPCSPMSGKSPRWVPVAVAGGCSVHGPLSTCVLLAHSTRVLTGCRGVSTSLRTRRVHLWSRACAHGPACPAVPIMQTPMHTHGCTAARARCAGTPAALPACACAQGQSQAPLCCAGTLGMEPQGAGVPSAIHSLGMLELASCRHVCVLYLPVMGRALGAGLQFVQIIIQVVTKPGMSKQLSSRGAHSECTRTRARLQPGSGAVDTGRQSTPAALGCAGEHERSIAHVAVTPTSQSGGFAWHRGSPWQMQRAGVVPAPRQCPVAGSLCLDTNILAVGTLQQAATQQARCSARHPSRGSNQK